MRQLRKEEGFGLLELIISITFLAVAMTAIASLLVSAFIASGNATTRATAGVIAEGQLENYYRVPWSQVRLKASGSGNAGGDIAGISSSDVYKTSMGSGIYPPSSSLIKDTDTTPIAETACPIGSNEPSECKPVQVVVGPDNHPFRIDTYVYWTTPASGAQTKDVLVVVRDYRGNKLGKILATSDAVLSTITAPSS
jgi:type II secretory pathway pseudopilin PulG